MKIEHPYNRHRKTLVRKGGNVHTKGGDVHTKWWRCAHKMVAMCTQNGGNVRTKCLIHE
jgi:hypothetical protein